MRFLIIGRLRGFTQASLAEILRRNGHQRTTSLRAADRIVLANEVVVECLERSGCLRAPLDIHADRVISETNFRTVIGLDEPNAASPFNLDVAAKVSGVSRDILRALQLADVISPDGGLNFSDLSLVRRIGNWLRRGFTVLQIIEAHQLASHGDVKLADAEIELLPFGAVGVRKGERLSRAGQIELVLDEPQFDARELFEAARRAETDGELELSTRLYEAVVRLDDHDAESAFNLGNVLEARGLLANAKIAYLRAIKVDPAFADAWCNLGVIAEQQSRVADAEFFYKKALQSGRDHTNTVWNLARILCDQERFIEALPMWEKLALLSPEDRTEAMKWSKVCRLMSTRSA